jgi:hypothetical protein
MSKNNKSGKNKNKSSASDEAILSSSLEPPIAGEVQTKISKKNIFGKGNAKR